VIVGGAVEVSVDGDVAVPETGAVGDDSTTLVAYPALTAVCRTVMAAPS
jgi:hypothetical protein